MIIGVDFDNTIVSYDGLFHRVARERGLIPAGLPVTKTAVRDHLRAAGREDVWTELQGEVYGARMAEAEAFPGVIEFFQACRTAGVPVRIISHKTRHPFRGAAHDLHAAAFGWLEQQGFLAPTRGGLSRDDVFFELTKSAKIARIGHAGCTVFIDDLPEILADAAFPPGVRKILFDPADAQAGAADFLTAGSWRALRGDLLERPAALARLLSNLNFRAAGAPAALSGGRNNRVQVIDGPPGERILVKEYFSAAMGVRNRFQAERDFYHYAWTVARVDSMPEPLAWDETAQLGLFEFVAGRKISSAEIDRAALDAAVAFVGELNALRALPAAQRLGDAAEACFSTADHLAIVQRRLERCAHLPGSSPLDQAARDFVRTELLPEWNVIRAEAVRPLADGGAGPGLEARRDRCLSPSDFGFHNALRRPDGRWVFFDFEYAGWDDPAKLVCDFFCQPDVPAPVGALEDFAAALASRLGLAQAGDFVTRCRALLPVHRIKWCGLLLNEFLGADRARRAFAGGAPVTHARKEQQLARARLTLAGLRACALA